MQSKLRIDRNHEVGDGIEKKKRGSGFQFKVHEIRSVPLKLLHATSIVVFPKMLIGLLLLFVVCCCRETDWMGEEDGR